MFRKTRGKSATHLFSCSEFWGYLIDLMFYKLQRCHKHSVRATNLFVPERPVAAEACAGHTAASCAVPIRESVFGTRCTDGVHERCARAGDGLLSGWALCTWKTLPLRWAGWSGGGEPGRTAVRTNLSKAESKLEKWRTSSHCIQEKRRRVCSVSCELGKRSWRWYWFSCTDPPPAWNSSSRLFTWSQTFGPNWRGKNQAKVSDLKLSRQRQLAWCIYTSGSRQGRFDFSWKP